MIANHLNGALHVRLVSYESLAEVVLLARLLQDFSLEERQGRVVPTRTAAVLVLDARDGVLLDDRKHGFVFVDRVFLFLCLCTEGK